MRCNRPPGLQSEINTATITLRLDRVRRVWRYSDAQAITLKSRIYRAGEPFFEQPAALSHRLYFAVADNSHRTMHQQRTRDRALLTNVTNACNPKSQALRDANFYRICDVRRLAHELHDPIDKTDRPIAPDKNLRSIAQLQMHVRVDQTWKDDRIAEVDHFGVGVIALQRLCITDSKDAILCDDDSIDPLRRAYRWEKPFGF